MSRMQARIDKLTSDLKEAKAKAAEAELALVAKKEAELAKVDEQIDKQIPRAQAAENKLADLRTKRDRLQAEIDQLKGESSDDSY